MAYRFTAIDFEADAGAVRVGFLGAGHYFWSQPDEGVLEAGHPTFSRAKG